MGSSPAVVAASLPPPRAATADQLAAALKALRTVFCLLPAATDFGPPAAPAPASGAAPVDSGYATQDEADDDDDGGNGGHGDDGDAAAARDAAARWLMRLVGRADQLPLDDAARESLVDDACSLLAHLTGGGGPEPDADADLAMTRHFEFAVAGHGRAAVSVDLFDTPMQTTDDHTDVGLQTWGASVALSDMVCRDPARFGLPRARPGARFLELGAGTGLFGLALASLLPLVAAADAWPSQAVVATDYHPAVLRNLRLNLDAHAARPGAPAAPLQACHLDWAAPSRAPPLDRPFDFIFAADVAYAPEHAAWLRDCAASLLTPDGVFWLMVSIRPNGKFRGIDASVETAFVGHAGRGDGRALAISRREAVQKHRSGRADETGYKLYRIVWEHAGGGGA